jgi:hypothetical protein
MFTITAALVLAGFAPARPHADSTRARQAMREAQAYAARDAASLWGVSLTTPLLVVDPRTRRAVSAERDSAGLMVAEGDTWSAIIPADVPIANTSLRWGDRAWAMVLAPLPADSVERGILLMHEVWHSVQAGVQVPLQSPDNPHLATAAGRTWLKVEGRALDSALASTGEHRKRAMIDALAARRARRAASPGSAATEQPLELSEGLAEFTGITLVAAPGERASLVRARLSRLDTEGSLVRSFPYATGAAWALLLDLIDDGWRAYLRPDTDLAIMAAEAMRINPDTLDLGDARFAPYGLREIRADEEGREVVRLARQDSLRARYVTGPTLRLPLAEMNMSFNPNNVEPLPDAGTVYRPFRLSDRWGVLDADSSGALVNTTFSEARVATPGPGGTSGPGWKVTLKPGWVVVPADRAGNYTIRKR